MPAEVTVVLMQGELSTDVPQVCITRGLLGEIGWYWGDWLVGIVSWAMLAIGVVVILVGALVTKWRRNKGAATGQRTEDH